MRIRLFMMGIGLLGLFAAAWIVHEHSLESISVMNREEDRFSSVTVILDAGHGGEDGGAVAPDGTLEKDLNLRYASAISDYFSLFGIPYIPTRTADVSVCDPSLPSIRERKRADILNRFALVEQTENAILVSIHQNLYTRPQYAGTQVFYAQSVAHSEQLAQCIQSSVVSLLQPENHREIKKTDSHIYLLYKATKPSVLVECGFLSNPEELEQLKSPSYTSALSYAVTKGVFNYLTRTEDT